MSRFVRPSKYRHVFGQTGKKEYGLENVKVSNSAWDTNLIDASAQYISLNWAASGGGAFAILPLPDPFHPLPHGLHYKLPDMIPLARGHSGPVLDTAWSPFDDTVVASGGEDGRVLIWKVEELQFEGWGTEGWEPTDFSPVGRISGSGRKVGQVLFHPTASHVLASAVGDHCVRLWDLGSLNEPRATLVGHTDTIQSLTFNTTGTLMVTTCRDRKLRMFDARAGGEAVRVTEGHGGVKGARVTWMGDTDKFTTTGFSKMSDRQVSIWESGSLANLKTVSIDQSAGVLMPFWSDNNILFLAGKGDGNIRYFEYENDQLYPLAEYKSSDPQRGMCFLPRRALNVSENEIARAYKVQSTGSVEAIAFICPRKADAFQADIYPPATSAEPSLTAGEFFTGKPIVRKLVSLEDGSISTVAATASSAPPTSSAPPAMKQPTKTTSAPAPAAAPLSTPMVAEPSPMTERIKTLPMPTTAPKSPVSPSPTRIEVSRSDSFRILTPKPQEPTSPDFGTFPSAPAVSLSPPAAAPLNGSSNDTMLRDENARLGKELQQAQAQIRALQSQVDTMRETAQRAAKALLQS